MSQLHIGIVGTFDVENYGDLLFPLIAEAELRARLGDVEVSAFSYNRKTSPEWPYSVTSVADLPFLVDSLDGLLIGGGFLIRFDKEVAPGYEPPDDSIHHPTGYWLTPALLAQQRGVPVVWNAPGMHRNDIPKWAEPLLELALELSSYIAVRDEPSRAALSPFAPANGVVVTPDTGFGIARLLGSEIAAEVGDLREATGITKPYVLIQSAKWERWVPQFLHEHASLLSDYQFVAVPVSPVLGEDADVLGSALPGMIRLRNWPHPLLMAALISDASAVIGHSYHMAITALSAGVPVFTPVDLSEGKFSALRDFETVHPLASLRASGPDWFRSRLGKTAPSRLFRERLTLVDQHWDRIVTVFRAGRHASGAAAIGRFWQSLPGLLESGELAAVRRQHGIRWRAGWRQFAEMAAWLKSRAWKAGAR